MPLPDALFPPVRREDDVHVADERPDDVVRGELPRRDSLHRAAVRVRDRRPDDEIDHRLGDHPDQVHVLSRRGIGTGPACACASRSGRSRPSTAGAAPEGAVGPERSCGALREDQLDHILDRRVLDRQIDHLLLAEEPCGDAGCVRLRHAQLHTVSVAFEHVAVAVEVSRSVRQRDLDRLVGGEPFARARRDCRRT